MSGLKIPNAFYRTSIKALVLNEKKQFLLAKEANGYWELLGGGLDFGEDPRDGLIREIKEETGLQATYVSEHPLYFLTYLNEDNGVWKSNVVYEVRLKNLKFTQSDECVELGFFDKESLQNVQAFTNVIKFAEMFDNNRQ